MTAEASGIEAYDRWAADYDRRWRHYTAVTLGQLLTQLDLGRCTDVLDIGCGTGTLLRLLRVRLPDAHLTGIDASAGMLQVARAKLAGQDVDLRHGLAGRVAVPDATMDLVTMANVLHYIRRPSTACADARRVLRPGGTLGVVDYVPRVGGGSFGDGVIRLYDPGHIRGHRLGEMQAIMTASGLSIVQARVFAIDCVFRGVLVIAQRPARGA